MNAATTLCGAWSLSDEPGAPPIADGARRAMLAAIEGGSGRVREFARGRLWLACAPGRWAESGARVLGAEGFLPGFSRAGEALLRPLPGALADLDGHFVLAAADLARDELVLARDASGAERLYYAEAAGTLLFAASVRLLLAHPAMRRAPDAEMAREYAMNGILVSPNRTLFDGVRELDHGQFLVVRGSRVELREGSPPPAPEPSGRLDSSAALRRALRAAVASAIGGRREATVALSGGSDSSSVAALAVELLGAGSVRAITYEFADAGLEPETEKARAACRHLGIRSHETVRIRFEDHFQALCETAWRSEESGSTRGNPALLLLARRAAADGPPLVLTGLGMEMLLRVPLPRHVHLRAVSRAAAGVPGAGLLFRAWRAHRFEGRAWPAALGWLHPGLRPPPEPLFFMALAGLWHQRAIGDIGDFFPPELRGLARDTARAEGFASALRRRGARSLDEQLLQLCLAGHDLPRQLPRKGKLAREAGAELAAPAYFPGCMSLSGRLGWHSARVPPASAKALLSEAVADLLPPEIAARGKTEDNMLVPPSWVERSMRRLEPALGGSIEALGRFFPERTPPLRRHFRANLLRLALWHRLFIEAPASASPPAWSDLGVA